MGIDVNVLKSNLDILGVIGRDVPLQSAGSKLWKGVEHDSLQVSPEDGLWHWWSRDAGGDVIRWVEWYHNLSFKEAIDFLSGMAGTLSLVAPTKPVVRPVKVPALYNPQIVKDAEAKLASSVDAQLLWSKQGIDHETQEFWRLGYTPSHWGVSPGGVIPYEDDKGNYPNIWVRMYGGEKRYLPWEVGHVPGTAFFAPFNIADNCVVIEGAKKVIVCSKHTGGAIQFVGLNGVTNFAACGGFEKFEAAKVKRFYVALDPGLTTLVNGKKVPISASDIKWVKQCVELGYDVFVIDLNHKPDDGFLDGSLTLDRFASLMRLARKVKL